jgi:hypothetical protein
MRLLTISLILCGAVAKPCLAEVDTLHALLLEARLGLDTHDGDFSGPGWRLIVDEAAKARIIAVGEDHITREVPEFVGALCDVIGPQGLAAMAFEVGPEVARFVQAGLLAPDHKARMADLTRRYPDSVAFLNVAEENDLATRCAMSSGAGPEFQIWGLDQEFFGAGGWLLDKILQEPLSADARAAVQALRAEEQSDAAAARASGDPSKLFIFRVSDTALQATYGALTRGGDETSRRLLQSLITTHHIYRENLDNPRQSNLDRALLLKKNLAGHLAAWTDKGARGKLLLKFGEWHIYRGYNPLDERDLGNYVAEYADVNLGPSLHIAVMGSRGVHASYGGYARPFDHAPFVLAEDDHYTWMKAAAEAAEPTGWTVFDLRRLRGHRTKDIPEEWRRLADGYDILVLAPEISPATRLGD